MSLSTAKPDPDHTDGHDNSNVADESTPLLPGGDEEAVSSRTSNSNFDTRLAPTPLPMAQLGALVAVRIVDPIAYMQIFPYINQFLVDLRVAKPDQVGFYSGLVESAYSLAQVFSVYQWGKISDVVGRRPVVFTGLVGIAMTTMAFGLSTSFASIVASRFFAGLVAGNVAVIHSILGEITDETNQDLAVPIYSLSWPLGIVIGPFIGGTLENAATRYPHYFAWRIFSEHPYLPPCIVSAVCALAGASLGYMFIEETLPSKRKHTPTGTPALGTRTDGNSNEVEYASLTALLSIPAIRALTISGFALSYLSLAFDVVFLLVCYAPIEAGGLGLEPLMIGNVFAFAGMTTVLLRVFALPHILRRFDYAKTYNVCMYVWPVLFGLLPFLNILTRREHPPSDSDGILTPTASNSMSALILTGLLTLLALSKIGAVPMSLSMLLIKRHAPSASALGRSNGLVQFAMCIGRAVAPVTVSTLFTGVNGLEWVRRWGVGWVWAVVMIGAGIWGARVTRGIGSG